MLLFRHAIPPGWLNKVQAHIPQVLIDHAHLERKAATSALTLEKYHVLTERVEALNAIAIEELGHFQLVMDQLRQRNIRFTRPQPSPWISGLMRSIRHGHRFQVIDHLICCALIEGRSCEKFQILADAMKSADVELSSFYRGLVESEGNHYATYLLFARGIDEAETSRRLDFLLDREAVLIQEVHPYFVLH